MLFEAAACSARCSPDGARICCSAPAGADVLLFTLGLMVSVAALWLAPVHHYALLAVWFLYGGFFVFGRKC